MDLRDRKVTIMGLGRHGGGVAAAQFCAEQGAQVTVTDLDNEQALADSLAQLRGVPIVGFTLGRHREEDFPSADVLVVNPAVHPDNRFVAMARRSGAQITSETELFLDACPASVIGVTGTVGKSTTAAMLAAILRSAGRHTWLGGNIGNSLLPDLLAMRPEHFVVLELSSFQLFWLSETSRWPRAAIVTNCSRNHLDWHGTWNDYIAAKQRLITHLPRDGFSVLNLDDLEVATWQPRCSGASSGPSRLEDNPPLLIPGEHNQINAACAVRMAKALGVSDEPISRGLGSFEGLPHRLQWITEFAGRQFYNDSKSTTPAATISALATMNRPTWLLLGGANKRNDFGELAAKVVHRAKGAALFGAAAVELETHLRRVDRLFPCFGASTLDAALAWCLKQAQPGEAILLSPACPSTDQFRDFAHRGEEFERLVRGLDEK